MIACGSKNQDTPVAAKGMLRPFDPTLGRFKSPCSMLVPTSSSIGGAALRNPLKGHQNARGGKARAGLCITESSRAVALAISLIRENAFETSTDVQEHLFAHYHNRNFRVGFWDGVAGKQSVLPNLWCFEPCRRAVFLRWRSEPRGGLHKDFHVEVIGEGIRTSYGHNRADSCTGFN